MKVLGRRAAHTIREQQARDLQAWMDELWAAVRADAGVDPWTRHEAGAGGAGAPHQVALLGDE